MTVLSQMMKELKLDSALSSAIAADYERFTTGLPEELEDYVRQRYRLDLSSEYGGLPIKNPFGKGSGQLSVNLSQVRKDAQDGLGFVVLKTIIAQDSEGAQSMSEWAVHETRMVVERITGADQSEGWTVTWKGRGWSDTFDAYLRLFADSLEADGLLASTHLLPQLAAAVLLDATVDQPGWVEARKVAARPYATATAALAYHDTARSLGEAALGNRENTLRVLDAYMISLQKLRDEIERGDDKSVTEFLDDAVKARDRWLNERTKADWQNIAAEKTDSSSFSERLNHMFLGRLMERNKKRK